MQTDLNALVFVDCYALSITLPSVADWVLLLEAYEAVNSEDEKSAVMPGGPHKWEVTFTNLRSTDALMVSPLFATSSKPEHEPCEIYKLKSEQISHEKTRIEMKSDYINGHFMCESVQVKRLTA